MSGDVGAIRLVDAVEAEDVDRVRELFRSYAVEYADSVVETFCLQGFDAEVASLPGKYAPPGGCLLLAMERETPAGCVGLRDLGGGTCEMKRLYVAPDHRGRGLGRRLAEEVIRRAERIGHEMMVLDTLPEMPEAVALYRVLGFVDNSPHWDCPVARTIFLKRPLGQSRRAQGLRPEPVGGRGPPVVSLADRGSRQCQATPQEIGPDSAGLPRTTRTVAVSRGAGEIRVRCDCMLAPGCRASQAVSPRVARGLGSACRAVIRCAYCVKARAEHATMERPPAAARSWHRHLHRLSGVGTDRFMTAPDLVAEVLVWRGEGHTDGRVEAMVSIGPDIPCGKRRSRAGVARSGPGSGCRASPAGQGHREGQGRGKGTS